MLSVSSAYLSSPKAAPAFSGQEKTGGSISHAPASDRLDIRFGSQRAPENQLDRMQRVMSMLMGNFDYPLSWETILQKLDFIGSSLMTSRPDSRAMSDLFQERFALLTSGSPYAEWDQIIDDVKTMKRLAEDGRGDEFEAYNHFFQDKGAMKDLILKLLHEEDTDKSDADFQDALTNRKTDVAEDLQNRPLFAAMLGLSPKATWADIRGAAADLSVKRDFDDLCQSDVQSLREQGIDVPDDASFGDLLDAALANGLFNG